jgi:hypothetical protein
VDEASEAVAAVDRVEGRELDGVSCLRWAQLERAVRPLAVVVVRVDAEDMLEVAAAQD